MRLFELSLLKSLISLRDGDGRAHGRAALIGHAVPARTHHRHGDPQPAPIQIVAAARLPLQPYPLCQAAEGQHRSHTQVY